MGDDRKMSADKDEGCNGRFYVNYIRGKRQFASNWVKTFVENEKLRYGSCENSEQRQKDQKDTEEIKNYRVISTVPVVYLKLN